MVQKLMHCNKKMVQKLMHCNNINNKPDQCWWPSMYYLLSPLPPQLHSLLRNYYQSQGGTDCPTIV